MCWFEISIGVLTLNIFPEAFSYPKYFVLGFCSAAFSLSWIANIGVGHLHHENSQYLSAWGSIFAIYHPE